MTPLRWAAGDRCVVRKENGEIESVHETRALVRAGDKRFFVDVSELELPAVLEQRHLTIVPPPVRPPESEVIVEPVRGGDFIVSLLREHGTTVAAVRYTRKQLEMLLARIPTALEIG